VEPFYRAKVDWEYVQSLLEAAMKERLKFERSWIIKAAKGATTLRGVYQNVVDQLEGPKKLRGIDESVNTNLRAYFDKVLPQLEENPFADDLDLAPGVNVMDLGHLSEEVQGLVIAACLEEIWEHGADTVVVIPEAWMFIPQQRGNPVKWSAQHVIRQGAANGIYLYLDSQDITTVDKSVIRSADVWLMGRQRELNEVKRVLAQLPTEKKPRPQEIMNLRVGHFIVSAEDWCRQVYVQPAWMDYEAAREVAMGNTTVDEYTPVEAHHGFNGDELPAPEVNDSLEEEDPMVIAELEQQLAEARGENVRLQGVLQRLEGSDEIIVEMRLEMKAIEEKAAAMETYQSDLRAKLKAFEDLDVALATLFQRYIPASNETGMVITKDELIDEVLARLGPGAIGVPVVTLAPVPALEELINNIQNDKLGQRARELLEEVMVMPPRRRQVLAVLTSESKPLPIVEVGRLLGHDLRASGGLQSTFSSEMRALVNDKWVYRDPKNGFKGRLPLKVKEELALWSPSDHILEGVVNNVLVELAQALGAK